MNRIDGTQTPGMWFRALLMDVGIANSVLRRGLNWARLSGAHIEQIIGGLDSSQAPGTIWSVQLCEREGNGWRQMRHRGVSLGSLFQGGQSKTFARAGGTEASRDISVGCEQGYLRLWAKFIGRPYLDR